MTNAKLPTPVRRVLAREADESQLARMWTKIESGERRRSGVRALALGGTAAVFALGLAVLLWVAEDRPGPLRLANGEPLVTVEGGVTSLSDGSQLETDADTVLEVLDNSETTFVLALRHGRVDVAVKPGGPRTWRIESGPLTIEVAGTAFAVERTGARVTVSVERGVVLVKGDGVPDRIRRLTAGQRLSVGPPQRRRDTSTRAPTTAPAPTLTPVPAPTVSARVPARTATANPLPTATPAPASAAPPLDAGVVASPTPALSAGEVLLQRADAAQNSGDFDSAAEALRTLLRDHADDDQASLAAVKLGNLCLDQLHDAHEAASAFERALEIGGMNDALEEKVYERLILALKESGQSARAAKILREMRQRFPTSQGTPP